jgi:hypothetical protein
MLPLPAGGQEERQDNHESAKAGKHETVEEG